MRKLTLIFSGAALSLAIGTTSLQADCGACEAHATEAKACSGSCEKACCQDAAQAKLTQVTYQIQGAVCAESCSTVDKALAQISGISKVASCPESKRTTVGFDAKKLDEKKLLAAIKLAGYKVDAQYVDYKVDGMSCSACSSKVSKAVAKLEGIKSNEVCHASDHAKIAFDPNKITQQQVIAAINSTGFQALPSVVEAPVQAN